jgi:hypothetical protein
MAATHKEPGLEDAPRELEVACFIPGRSVAFACPAGRVARALLDIASRRLQAMPSPQ